jgi:hypothetical protein
VLTLAGNRISAMTRFENSVLPWFGLPRSLPSPCPTAPARAPICPAEEDTVGLAHAMTERRP